MSEKTGDVVYTPEWVARDMVAHFRPTGTVLDPCRGKGVFHDLLPEGSPWCEVTDGRDFFDWTERVDWVISNPPYSLTRKWFRHSYLIADNLVYLIPLRNLFSGYGFVREVYEFGGIAEMRMYGTGGRLGFPMGNAAGAVHVRRGHVGPAKVTFYDDQPNELAIWGEPTDLGAVVEDADGEVWVRAGGPEPWRNALLKDRDYRDISAARVRSA